MHALKPLLLNVYYHSTYGYRQWWTRHTARRGRAAMVAPVFHRVADDAANDWTTPTAAFHEAITWLQANFDLISLEEAQRRIRAGQNDRPSISLTFDDGYAVNMPALEMLIERKIPCTYFVSTQPALDRLPFEHDRRMGNNFEANTVEELKYLAASGIEIGAHTRTHADLARVADHEKLYDELVVARDDLQEAVGAPIRYFAFPFGLHKHLSARAFHMAREAGYEGVCSAYGGYNFPGDDPFHIQRRCVDGAAICLKNWAILDPLRYGRIQRFEYQQQESLPAPAVAGSV